jgi:hypothetical protein
MLRCPKCGRTYEPETQKFCTHDGGRLVPDEHPASSQAPTTYDLNQTVTTDPFDPEATVTRLPDLNKTVAAAPTSEIRPKDTGPAAAPPQAPPYQPSSPEPTPPAPPAGRESQPTIAFNQSYPPPPPPPPQQPYYPPPPPMHTPHAVDNSGQAHAQHQQQQQHQPQHYAPAQYQQPGSAVAATATARRGKSSRMPLIIGLVVVLLLGGAAAWYFLVYKKNEAGGNANVANANANATANANNNQNTGANANASADKTPQPPQPPPPNSTEFVNANASLDGKLAEYYSDFSFYYPNTWEKDPKTGVAGASNFVRVERRLPPDFTQENFGVSWYESRGTFEADEAEVFPKLVDSLKARYAKSFPEFEALSEGETTVNGIKGYEFNFQSVSRGTEKGDITLWGRVVFLPPGVEGKKNGVQLLMLTTSLAPELSSAEDVGVKGELPMILKSFRMGSR